MISDCPCNCHEFSMSGKHGKVGCVKCGYIKKNCPCKLPEFRIRDAKTWMDDIGEKF